MDALRGADAAPRMKIDAGRPWPMGTHWTGQGVNVAVYSSHASAIELCLFDAAGHAETARLHLPARTGDVFHGFVGGLAPGQIYGLRAHGPWALAEGHRFNPHKLLLDPYAREIVGRFEWRAEHKAGAPGDPDRMDRRDNGPHALKARVVADSPPPPSERRTPTPWPDTLIYELHVAGFSRLNPAVPAALRGTYAGLGHAASVDHLVRLGVTAVELLPVHQRIDEERLVAMGLTNYWGYNSIGFFCPEPRLAAARDPAAVRAEFRAMVASLHAAGIEVLLDVVFNHTAESDEHGPTISFRGLDNAACYRLDGHDRRRYQNHAGCGNTVDIRNPKVLQWVLDSLRYWVTDMHVDGYRFDLATVLGRGDHGFDAKSAFFTAVAQDPVLAGVKLIAEPWDIGPGGYQVGHFPCGWAEWNDRFRDDLRGFWLRGAHHRGALARRLCGSSDLFQRGGRMPAASINYLVSHDGFTLADLVSHERRHNEANGEANRDGTAHNLSTNCGTEGPSDDPQVRALRARLQRVLLATTLLAQGTPMLSQGDELGHTQGGNNNPYCHDSPVTWIDWARADAALLAFTARVAGLRRELMPFADRWYAAGPHADGLAWSGGDGEPLHDGAWNDDGHRALGCRIERAGRAAGPLLLLLNGCADDLDFVLPPGPWRTLLDTAESDGSSTWHCAAGAAPASFPLRSHSLALLAAGST